MNPEHVAGKIAIYEAQIERLYRQIEELYYSPIWNEEGEIVSYQDWEIVSGQDELDNY